MKKRVFAQTRYGWFVKCMMPQDPDSETPVMVEHHITGTPHPAPRDWKGFLEFFQTRYGDAKEARVYLTQIKRIDVVEKARSNLHEVALATAIMGLFAQAVPRGVLPESALLIEPSGCAKIPPRKTKKLADDLAAWVTSVLNLDFDYVGQGSYHGWEYDLEAPPILLASRSDETGLWSFFGWEEGFASPLPALASLK